MEIANKRSKRILNILMDSPKPLTGQQLAFSIDVTSRTIRNDIKELNSYLEDYGVEIVSKSGEGYSIPAKSREKLNKLMVLFQDEKSKKNKPKIIPSNPQDRVGYLVSRLLISSLSDEEHLDFFDLADELAIGSSTLKKDFRSVESIIKNYGLKISNTKKYGIRIVGEEAHIRYCISQYVFNSVDAISLEDNPIYQVVFDSKTIAEAKRILEEEISESELSLTDVAYKNLLIHLLIMLKRSEKFEPVNYKDIDLRSFENTQEFKCAQRITNKLEHSFQMRLESEKYYITQLLLSSQRFQTNSEQGNTFNGTPKILEVIRDKTGIDLLDDQLLVLSLDTHLSTALQRIRFNMNIRNDLLDMIKTKYPLAFELAILAGKIIQEEYSLKMHENEIGFIAMHFAVALERKGLNSETEAKKIIIVCGSGMVTAMLMKEKIEALFSDRIKIVELCPSSGLTQEKVDDIDFVLTTVPCSNVVSEKIIRVKIFLDDQDIKTISAAVTGHLEEKIDLSEIIKRNLFFPELDLSSKSEVLEFMTEQARKHDYISESVKESIFKREEMATTELGSLLAIPHALLNDMENASIGVAVLKKPVIWDEEKVQVVLLLNIPNEFRNMWDVLFKRLYQNLIEEQGVLHLIQNRDYDEFISELKKEEN